MGTIVLSLDLVFIVTARLEHETIAFFWWTVGTRIAYLVSIMTRSLLSVGFVSVWAVSFLIVGCGVAGVRSSGDRSISRVVTQREMAGLNVASRNLDTATVTSILQCAESRGKNLNRITFFGDSNTAGYFNKFADHATAQAVVTRMAVLKPAFESIVPESFNNAVGPTSSGGFGTGDILQNLPKADTSATFGFVMIGSGDHLCAKAPFTACKPSVSVPNDPGDFEGRFDMIISWMKDNCIVPIIGTKADELEKIRKQQGELINEAMARVADKYGVPFFPIGEVLRENFEGDSWAIEVPGLHPNPEAADVRMNGAMKVYASLAIKHKLPKVVNFDDGLLKIIDVSDYSKHPNAPPPTAESETTPPGSYVPPAPSPNPTPAPSPAPAPGPSTLSIAAKSCSDRFGSFDFSIENGQLKAVYHSTQNLGTLTFAVQQSGTATTTTASPTGNFDWTFAPQPLSLKSFTVFASGSSCNVNATDNACSVCTVVTN